MTELSRIEQGAGEDAPFDAAELGAMMREMRVAMQRDLKDISQELCIRRHYLEAIENGRLDELPGPAYTTGFLRTYAEYLGLDGEDIVGRFKKAGISIDRRTNLILPSPLEEGRLPTGSVLLFAAFIAIVSYAGWYYISTTGHAPADEIAALPQEFERAAMKGQGTAAVPDETGGDEAAARPNPVETLGTVDTWSAPGRAKAAPSAQDGAARTAASSSGDGANDAPAVTTVARAEPPADGGEAHKAPPAPPAAPAAAQSAAAATPAPAPQTEPAPASRASALPLPPPPLPATVVAERAAPSVSQPIPAAAAPAAIEPAAAPAAADRARIVIRATDDSWVEISAGGTTLYSKLMRAGDRYEIASRPGLMLVTGNAGGLVLEVDGTAVPPLGRTGQILQDVAIDSSSLRKRVAASP